MTNTTTTRGGALATPGDRMVVWDSKGRAWTRDLPTDWWICDAPMTGTRWAELVTVAGPVYALPATRSPR